MGNKNDLIRRGDAIAVAHTARENRQAIARGITALPAAFQTGGWGGVAENVRKEEKSREDKMTAALDLFAWFCTGILFVFILSALF